ncbi:single-stranded DNA-binding protein [Abyssisolibacter fermentans]|uniref:single-stranded DNA-binding protein n=1 Tax=Abyssisolibacter fermentans TaxID=1766203 RepID=UPI00083074F7|nr:single-stranded DNA-binding protein [Abyssisolibacter fermentans]
MNSVLLIGRLTANPELRFLPGNGIAVTRFSLAVDKDLSKEKKAEAERLGKPTADFPKIVVWDRQAENCANYLAKGRLVAIQGRIQTGSYKTIEGYKRYTTEVVAERVKFLDYGNRQQNNYDATGGFQPVDDEDIPF